MLYAQIAPYLRWKRPSTPEEAEGKTDFICFALLRAAKEGNISEEDEEKILALVHAWLKVYGFTKLGTAKEVADKQNFWPTLVRGTAEYEAKLQGWRHALLAYWCKVVEMDCKLTYSTDADLERM